MITGNSINGEIRTPSEFIGVNLISLLNKSKNDIEKRIKNLVLGEISEFEFPLDPDQNFSIAGERLWLRETRTKDVDFKISIIWDDPDARASFTCENTEPYFNELLGYAKTYTRLYAEKMELPLLVNETLIILQKRTDYGKISLTVTPFIA